MKLELTRRNLKRISEHDEPAVEDVLNFIYDFCQDVKNDTGKTADKLECREEDAMYKRLPWMGRFVMKVSKDKESALTDPGRREHLQEISGRLDEVVKQSEEVQNELASVRQERENLRQREEQVRAEKQNVLDAMAENDAIRARIRSLEEMDISAFAAQKEQLSKEYDAKMAELDTARNAAAMAERALESARQQLESQNRQIQELEQEQNSIEQQKLSLEQQKKEMEETRAGMRETVGQAESELEEVKADCISLQQKIEERDMELAQARKKAEELEALCDSETEQIRIQELDKKTRQIEELEERVRILRQLKKDILRDWAGPWGIERRTASGADRQPEEILQNDLTDIRNRLNMYSEDLRRISRILSTAEYA